MTHTVTLRWSEQVMAGVCGILRRAEAVRMGLKREYSSIRDHPLTTDIDASGAEEAVAKHIGRYWLAGVNAFEEPDILPDIEVRHTRYENGHLIIRKDAPDDRRFVLVRGTIPTYEIVGWIRAGNAKQPRWLRDPNNDGECWMIPAEQLTDIALLK